MNIRILALAAASAGLLAAGSAHAQEYGAPPYSVGGYGGGCEGFTLAGAYAGFTVLGINVGGAARASIGDGECGGYQGAAYAPPPPAYPVGYQSYGGYYNQGGYAPVAYASPPVYAQPVYSYQQPAYGYGQPCGCGQAPVVYQPY